MDKENEIRNNFYRQEKDLINLLKENTLCLNKYESIMKNVIKTTRKELRTCENFQFNNLNKFNLDDAINNINDQREVLRDDLKKSTEMKNLLEREFSNQLDSIKIDVSSLFEDASNWKLFLRELSNLSMKLEQTIVNFD